MLINHFCDSCGRNMGDIDEPICHQCEIAELDAIEDSANDRERMRLEANRARIMSV